MTALTAIERDDLRRLVAAASATLEATGADDIVRRVRNSGSGLSAARQADRRTVARALRELGWRRDGWTGVGYDREPRYVR